METKFDIGEEVYIKAVVERVTIKGENNIVYSLKMPRVFCITGNRADCYEENIVPILNMGEE